MEGFTACLQMRLVQNMYTLTYIHKNGSLAPLFWKMFTDCLQMPSLNSQRKTKSAPPSQKIFLTYMNKNGLLNTLF